MRYVAGTLDSLEIKESARHESLALPVPVPEFDVGALALCGIQCSQILVGPEVVRKKGNCTG